MIVKLVIPKCKPTYVSHSFLGFLKINLLEVETKAMVKKIFTTILLVIILLSVF